MVVALYTIMSHQSPLNMDHERERERARERKRERERDRRYTKKHL